MNIKSHFSANRIGLLFCAALLPVLVGCVAESRSRVQTSAGYVQTDVMVDDDYVYYPGYEVYYSSHRHQFMYRDGSNWVTRATPPRVSAEVLLASPSVRVDFHDSPAQHHAAVVKSYPKNWKPAANSPAPRKESPNVERKDDKDNRGENQKREKDDDDKRHN
jgi:hypothetical protein